MKKWQLRSAFATVASLAAIGAVFSVHADADNHAFDPIPAAANMRSLEAGALPFTPATIARLPAEIRPSNVAVYKLGHGGHAWRDTNGGVCVAMANFSGACIKDFERPVLLFLSGRFDNTGRPLGPQDVTGLVPDSVREVVLVTSSGRRVPVMIAENAFAVQIPSGEGISGEIVTLADGTKSFYADVLRAPESPPIG